MPKSDLEGYGAWKAAWGHAPQGERSCFNFTFGTTPNGDLNGEEATTTATPWECQARCALLNAAARTGTGADGPCKYVRQCNDLHPFFYCAVCGLPGGRNSAIDPLPLPASLPRIDTHLSLLALLPRAIILPENSLDPLARALTHSRAHARTNTGTSTGVQCCWLVGASACAR
jgi:hypothetical protein